MEKTNQNLLSAHKIFENNMSERQIITESKFHDIYGGSDKESDFKGFSDVGFIDLEREGDEESRETNYENDEDWTEDVVINLLKW